MDFDGVDLVTASAAAKRNMLGKRIAYVAQSAAASFNPAHRLIDQHTEAPTQHKLRAKAESELDGMELYRRLRLPDPRSHWLSLSASGFRRAIAACDDRDGYVVPA